MNSWRKCGLMPSKKSICVKGAFLTTSRLARTCAYCFIPTTVPNTDYDGIDLINCRWRAGML